MTSLTTIVMTHCSSLVSSEVNLLPLIVSVGTYSSIFCTLLYESMRKLPEICQVRKT